MGKLQSTDYIFIIGLIVLIGIAGSIIYLITTAEVVDPKDKEPGITINTDNNPPDKKPPVQTMPNVFPDPNRIVLNDAVVSCPYKQWEPAPKYEFESKYIIRGVVTDANNVPLKDAEVGITPLSVLDDTVMAVEAKQYDGEKSPEYENALDVTKYDISGISPAYKTRTNELGQYEFPYFTGYFVLFVKKQLYYEQKILSNYDGYAKDFKLDKWGHVIGRVLDSSGRPIPDYMITVYKAKSSKIAGTANLIPTGFETDDFRVLRYTYHVRNMKFGMYLPEGLFDVVISANNFNEMQLSGYKVVKNQEEEENFRLFGNTKLVGTISVKGKSDIPISNVSITIQEISNDGYKAIRRTMTDDDGKYEFDITRPGSYKLSCAHELYRTKQVNVKVVENQTCVQDIELDAGTYLVGTVLNNEDQVVERADINFSEYPRSQKLGVRAKHVFSDHSGRFVVPELRPGTYMMRVTSRQYYYNHLSLVTIVEGENQTTVKLIKGITVKLNLMSDAPLPEMLAVELRRNEEKSKLPVQKLAKEYDIEWSEAYPHYSGHAQSKEGAKYATVEISGVYPGPYFINIRDDNFIEINEPIEIPEGVKTIERTINISSGFAISGVVKDDKGNVIPNAAIRILQDSKYIKSARVDKEGKFFIQGLSSEKYLLRIEAREFISIEQDIQLTSSIIDKVYTLSSGEVLTGSILDPEGNPVREGIGVKLIAPPRGEYERYPITRTDKDGKFRLQGLNKGTFKLEIIGAEGIQVDNKEVQVPGNVEIHLSLGLKISGTVKDHENNPVNRARLLVRKPFKNSSNGEDGTASLDMDEGIIVESAITNENGEYLINGLESGNYVITLYNGSNPTSRKVINLTSDLELNFQFEQTYDLSGTIKYTNGEIPKRFFIRLFLKTDKGIGSASNINSSTGEFHISDVQAGLYILELVSHYSPAGVYQQEVNVPQNGPLQIQIEEIKFFRVLGKVLDDAGNPMEFTRIQFMRADQPTFIKYAAGKDDGTFEAQDLLPGVYKILVLSKERKILSPVFELKIVDADVTDLELKATKVINGVYVKSVRPESFGAEAGLQTGDIIIEYNGAEVFDGSKLSRLSLRAIGSAAQVAIKIIRGGKEQTLMIQPGEIGLTN